jgi:hypothetical protein
LRTGLAILHFALIFYCVYALAKKQRDVSKRLFWGGFLVRLAAGTALGLIYTYYYSASDTWQFFQNAKLFSALGRKDFVGYLGALIDFSENQSLLNELVNQDLRSIFFIKIISVFCLVGLDNYWVCSAYFSLLAFVSAWALHSKIVRLFPDSSSASALAFLFFPSVVFWSSGLEKESLAMCGIYFLTTGFLSLIFGEKPGQLFWWALFSVCYVVWSLKYYWAIIFLGAVLTALIIRFMSARSTFVNKHLTETWGLLFFGIGALLSFTHPNFYLHRFLEVILSNYNEFAAISNPKNLIQYYQLDQRWISIIINSPWALLSGLFRPIIGEGQGILGLIASLENFFIIVLAITQIVNFRKAFTSTHKILVLAVLSYCVVLCVFLALSTPNFGTLSRYRIGFLPFFVFLMAYRNPIINWIWKKLGLSSS